MSAQYERWIIRLKRRVGLWFWHFGNAILRSLPAVPLKFPAAEWQRRPPIPSVSEIQEAAHRAFEKCSTHPRPGEFVQAFNRVKQASAPMAQLPPPRQHTDTFAPVSRPLSVDFMPTMRADTPREGMLRVQRPPEPRVQEDRFLVVGPDLLFESVDKVPTITPLSRSDRDAMRESAGEIFEEPPQTTGALDMLAILAAQKPDDHTVPALEAIRLKHTKGIE